MRTVSSGSTTPSVQLRAGEVTYIGNFDIGAGKFPTRILGYRRNDKSATEALQQRYPGIQVPLTYQRPKPIVVANGRPIL